MAVEAGAPGGGPGGGPGGAAPGRAPGRAAPTLTPSTLHTPHITPAPGGASGLAAPGAPAAIESIGTIENKMHPHLTGGDGEPVVGPDGAPGGASASNPGREPGAPGDAVPGRFGPLGILAHTAPAYNPGGEPGKILAVAAPAAETGGGGAPAVGPDGASGGAPAYNPGGEPGAPGDAAPGGGGDSGAPPSPPKDCTLAIADGRPGSSGDTGDCVRPPSPEGGAHALHQQWMELCRLRSNLAAAGFATARA